MAGIRVQQRKAPVIQCPTANWQNEVVMTDITLWNSVHERAGYLVEKTVCEDEMLAYMVDLEKAGFEIFEWIDRYIILERYDTLDGYAIESRVVIWPDFFGQLDEYPKVDAFVPVPLP